MTDAANAHEVTPSTIYKRIREGVEGYEHLDWEQYEDNERFFDDPFPPPVYQPATLRCLCCQGEFESWDKVRNRMCPACVRRGSPADDDWE